MRRIPGLMPRPETDRRAAIWQGASDGYNRAVDLVAGTAFYGGIGYLLDRWLGTWPVIFVIGAVVGNLTAIYSIYKRSATMHDKIDLEHKAMGVTRAWPKKR
ncbi:MAG: AtpZ/AtpI family protein [Actinomycetota bacterium]